MFFVQFFKILAESPTLNDGKSVQIRNVLFRLETLNYVDRLRRSSLLWASSSYLDLRAERKTSTWVRLRVWLAAA